MSVEKALWYFDLISPFSYLHFKRLMNLQSRLQIQPVPVLFAGLLKHWGTKGPAELEMKRLHTYQYCVWVASQVGVPFKMPPRHPFNPLPSLRLLASLGPSVEDVGRAFDFVYGQGRDPEVDFQGFAQALGVPDAPDALTRIAQPSVKSVLASNTQQAIQAGVFGVPTLLVNEQLFWGNDTVDWVLAYLNDPGLFQRAEYQAAARSEFGVARSS